MPGPGGQYLLAGRECVHQTGHNDFDFGEDRSLRFSVLVSRSKVIYLIVRPMLRSNMQYLVAETRKHTELLHLKEAAFSS